MKTGTTTEQEETRLISQLISLLEDKDLESELPGSNFLQSERKKKKKKNLIHKYNDGRRR